MTKNDSTPSPLAALLRYLLLGLFYPLVFSLMIYVGATTNYTTGVFSEKGFHAQYDSGIYKYRVLGKESFLLIKGFVDTDRLPRFKPGITHSNGSPISSVYYATYFYNNTLFLILTCLILCATLGVHKSKNFNTTDLPIICAAMLMTLTQYVVVPYDTATYFFLSIGIFLTLRDKQSLITGLLLLVTVILATLTRETALLIVSFYVAYHFKALLTTRLNSRHINTLVAGCGFIATYTWLRVHFGFEHALFQDVQFFKSMNIFSLAGFLFFTAFISSLVLTGSNDYRATGFLITSLPYTLMVLIVGMPHELRLWIPIFIPLLVLKSLQGRELLPCR